MKIKHIILFVLLVIACNNTVQQKHSEDMKTNEDWKQKLTDEQYRVTRLKGTERPFTGIYDNFYEKGSYYCVCCNSLLFDSESKFSSGCGWPSFSDIFNRESIKLVKDTSHNMSRTEVLCSNCDAHLGHVFNDGPPPTGLRYCINSVALHFMADMANTN